MTIGCWIIVFFLQKHNAFVYTRYLGQWSVQHSISRTLIFFVANENEFKSNYNIFPITLYESNQTDRPHCLKTKSLNYTVNKLLTFLCFGNKIWTGNLLMLKCWFLTQTLSLFYKLKTIFKTHIFILHIESFNFFILTSSATFMSLCLFFYLLKKSIAYTLQFI